MFGDTMHIWTYGLQTLYLESEDVNEYDKNAVAVIIDEKTGGRIPKNLSAFQHFLTVQ